MPLWYGSNGPSLRKGGSVGDGPCPAKTIRNTPKRSRGIGLWTVPWTTIIEYKMNGLDGRINRDAMYHASDSLLLRKGGSVGDGPCPARTTSNRLIGT